MNSRKEIPVCVLADSRLFVRSNIGQVQGAEWQHEGEAAGERRAIFCGMTDDAVRGTRQIFTPLNETRGFKPGWHSRRIRVAI
jgi:hypothetical protein